jgi:hypothetical protein
MGKVVVAGRRELVRLQSLDPTSLVPSQTPPDAAAVPISRARRAAERLRQATGGRG